MLHVHLKVYSAFFVWRVPGLGLVLGQWTASPLPNPLQVIELLFWPSYPEVAFPSSLLLPMPAVTHLGVAAETQKVKKEKVTENSPYFNP